MAKHLEIVNDNNNVIIDDQYNVPMLIWRGIVVADYDNRVVTPPNFNYIYYQYTRYDWSGDLTLLETANLDAIPFVLTTGTNLEASEIGNSAIVACRSAQGYACKAECYFNKNAAGTYKLNVYVECEAQNAEVEVCVYTMAQLKPRSPTLAIFNGQQRMIYDAMRPPFHFLGSCYGGVNARNNPAATYDIALPPNVETANVFLTSRAAMPYYAAYRVSGGGVSWADTPYKAVMTFPSASQCKIQLWRVRGVRGNNSDFSTNLYFENLIYCPYPLGKYF